jgi:trehalose 6-phosphate synthase/phosphatase
MYQAADVALVTPIRDGMNLVALEYIAARGNLGARLILSEFAGAAYLLPGARLVNPYNIAEVAQALADELEGGPRDWSHMLDFVEENTSQSWAERFLAELERTRDYGMPRARFTVDQPAIQKRLIRAKHPLVLLDYDGTLRGYEQRPEQATPTPRIRETLTLLAEHASVYIISGRPLEVLEAWFGDLPIGLVCEHGLSTREVGGTWREISTSHTSILKRVETLFEEFKRRTPGASIERKKASVAWHHRSADPEFGLFQAGELLAELEDLLRKRPYGVLRGNRVIEVRHLNCTKGNAAEQLLRKHKSVDAVLCAGGDRTDEDMLEAVRRLARDKSVTCWVGGHNLLADYWADSPQSFLEQLEQLGRLWQGRKATKASSRRRLAGAAR